MNKPTTHVRRNMIGAIVLSFVLCIIPAFGAGMVLQEYAAEIDAVHLGNTPQSGGLFYVKQCDHCPIIGVSFQPNTLFFLNNQQISTKQALNIVDGGATVFFDPTSRFVTRVVYWKEI